MNYLLQQQNDFLLGVIKENLMCFEWVISIAESFCLVNVKIIFVVFWSLASKYLSFYRK